MNSNKQKPSPHQEGWAERWHKGVWTIEVENDPTIGDGGTHLEMDYDKVESFIRQELTALHKADCERFRGMIGEDEHCNRVDHFSDSSCCDNKEERNMFRAELRTALSKMEEEV